MNKITRAVQRAIAIMALVGIVCLVTGCRNTAEGMGKDIENTGEKIQEKVD